MDRHRYKVSRRRLLGFASATGAVGAAGAVGAGGRGRARRPSSVPAHRTGRGHRPLPRHVPGGDRAAGPGPDLRRGLRPHRGGLRADGTPDAGLLFVCFQTDPLNGFVPVQRKLAGADALSRFIRHESSGLYAVPGGARPGGYVGQELLES
jgi:deferrochelatase/peroxidase EfeB